MQHILVIEPKQKETHYWLELWRYRELFRVLMWRDLSVRYKQTVIGVLWALIRPVMAVVIFRSSSDALRNCHQTVAHPMP